MKTYYYKARDKYGKSVSGLMAADSENTIACKLKDTGYIPIEIKSAPKESLLARFIDGLKGVSFSDLNMFTRQLFVLQRAGLPILLSLASLREQTSSKSFAQVLGKVVRDIEAGTSFSEALEKHPSVFSPIYSNLVKAGETSGQLSEVLERLATLGEHQERIRLRINAATRYPILVVTALIVGFLLLITLVIPRFARLYDRFTTSLPLPTQMLLWINHAVRNFWWVILLVVLGGIFVFRMLIKTSKGRYWWDSIKLQLPVFGPLTLKLVMSRFARVTGFLMDSGVPLMQVLQLAEGSTGNVVISRTIRKISDSVNQGKGMSEPMKISGMFPSPVVQMVAVGEESGKVDELLLHVSDYYDSQTEYTIANLTTLIEPILIVILGGIVLFMALGIFLPMWNMISLFRR